MAMTGKERFTVPRSRKSTGPLGPHHGLTRPSSSTPMPRRPQERDGSSRPSPSAERLLSDGVCRPSTASRSGRFGMRACWAKNNPPADFGHVQADCSRPSPPSRDHPGKRRHPLFFDATRVSSRPRRSKAVFASARPLHLALTCGDRPSHDMVKKPDRPRRASNTAPRSPAAWACVLETGAHSSPSSTQTSQIAPSTSRPSSLPTSSPSSTRSGRPAASRTPSAAATPVEHRAHDAVQAHAIAFD